MKRSILFLFFVFCLVITCRKAIAQVRKLDSLTIDLKQRLKNCGTPCKVDTSIITTEMKILSIYYNSGEYDSTTKYCQLIMKHSEQAGFKKGSGMAFMFLGLVDMMMGRQKESIENITSCLAIRQELNDKKGIIKCYSNMGLSYGYNGNLPKALEMHLKSLEEAKKMGDKPTIAMCYCGVGNILLRQGKYPEAQKNLLPALKIQEEIKNEDGMAVVCNTLGNLFGHQKEYEKSLAYYNRALTIRKVLN